MFFHLLFSAVCYYVYTSSQLLPTRTLIEMVQAPMNRTGSKYCVPYCSCGYPGTLELDHLFGMVILVVDD